jgi:hypothetical protein
MPYESISRFKGAGISTRFAPSRVVALLAACKEHKGSGALQELLAAPAAVLRAAATCPIHLPLCFVLLFRALQGLHRSTRRWVKIALHEMLAPESKQDRALFEVDAHEQVELAAAAFCELVSFLSRHVDHFGSAFFDGETLPGVWREHLGVFELRSWQHGFWSNVMAAFSVTHCVFVGYMARAANFSSPEGRVDLDLVGDSGDEAHFKGSTVRPGEAAWLMDLIGNRNLCIEGSRGTRNAAVHFEREEPFNCTTPLSGESGPEKLTNFALKPLIASGRSILQHLFVCLCLPIPLALRAACTATPPAPTNPKDITTESAVGVNAPSAWGGTLNWIQRRQVLLQRLRYRTDAQLPMDSWQQLGAGSLNNACA